MTPWNTHLGSEESDPDARLFYSSPTFADLKKASSSLAGRLVEVVRYFGLYASDFSDLEAYYAAAKTVFNPYK